MVNVVFVAMFGSLLGSCTLSVVQCVIVVWLVAVVIMVKVTVMISSEVTVMFGWKWVDFAKFWC